MKAYIVDAKKFNGNSKSGKDMNGVFVHFVAENRIGRECKSTFINMEVLCGNIPSAGDVLDIYYNDRGYIDSVVPDSTRRCKFIVENVNVKV